VDKERDMKVSIIAASLALGLAAAHGTALAQDSTVTESRITVGSTEPTPESPDAARREASAALAQAKRECRKEQGHDAQASCLAAAHEDYRKLMAIAHGQHGQSS
jgi:hypothetical protein